MSQYDVIVIGSGPGGYVAAIHAAQQGHKTAIVERDSDKRLGGTCLLRGCIPTKAMLHTADLLYDMQRSESFGITPVDAAVDMKGMDAYRAKVVDKNANGVKYLMKKNKIDVILGHGRITGKHAISVTDHDDKVTEYKTKHLILATGSACRHIGALPIDRERIIDSDDLLYSTEKPAHLVVLGAGAVGSEFASVFLRYGSKVTLIEMQDRILPIEDAEVSREVEKSFKKQGMNVLTSTKLDAAKRDGDEVHITVTGADGKSDTIVASHLLVAIGRRPVTEDVGLDKTSVVVDDRGFIEVDEYMQTKEPWIYAIGDIVNTPWLAHVASREGILAVDHLGGATARPLNYGRVPNCTYCSPEVASVGLTEEAAKAAGLEITTGVFPFSAIGKASIIGKSEGFIKLITGKKYKEILGVHIVGPKATELISEGTLALELEATIDELLQTIHPHPTLAEAMGEAAHAVTGHTIHI